jgi:hypothetical protein
MGGAMSGLPATRRINTPADLSTLLRELKEAVGAGILEQVRPDPSPFATDAAISDIADRGPWRDYIELRFRSRGESQQYKLVAETYHGTGGTWGPD